MTDYQANKLARSISVKTYLMGKSVITGKIPAFEEAIAAHSSIIEQIQQLDASRPGVKAGLTKEKEEIEKKLISLLFPLISAMNSYATISNNKTLYEETDLSENDLKKMRDVELHEYAVHAAALAEANKVELANYLITDAEIAGVNDAAAEFHSIQGITGTANAIGKNKTAGLKSLFDQLDEILYKKIDKFVDIFKTSEPDFWSEYQNAKNIIDR